MCISEQIIETFCELHILGSLLKQSIWNFPKDVNLSIIKHFNPLHKGIFYKNVHIVICSWFTDPLAIKNSRFSVVHVEFVTRIKRVKSYYINRQYKLTQF